MVSRRVRAYIAVAIFHRCVRLRFRFVALQERFQNARPDAERAAHEQAPRRGRTRLTA